MPSSPHLRWPAVGEPFLGAWKAHSMDLVWQRQEDARAGAARGGRSKRKPEGPALPRSPRPGTKRKREGAAPPPSHSQQARLERLAKARRLLDAQGGSSSTPSTSSASPTGGPPSQGEARGFSQESSHDGEGGPRAFASRGSLRDLNTEQVKGRYFFLGRAQASRLCSWLRV